MPVIAHPLVSDQVNGEFFESFGDQSFKGFKVSVFEEDIVSSVSTIERMIDSARFIRSGWSSHLIFSQNQKAKSLTSQSNFAYPLKTVPDT